MNRLLVAWISLTLAAFATAQDTRLLAEIYPGSTGSRPSQMTKVNGKILFLAKDPKHGNELWTTDGTAKGTRLLKDIRPGPADGVNSTLVAAGGHVFFFADDGRSGRELWCSDGTTTRLVADIKPGPQSSAPRDLVAGQSGVYFLAQEKTWIDIWWATGGGAVKTGATFYRTVPTLWRSGVLRDRLFYGFRKSVREPNTICLWMVHGTGAPVIVKEGVSPITFRVFKDKLFFAGKTAAEGDELWVTDGSGASLVKDIVPGSAGSSLWQFTPLGDRMYFYATDAAHGRELWVTDGTAGGTKLAVDVNPGPASGVGGGLTACRDELYFFGDIGLGRGSEPIRSDGTKVGTWMLHDVNPGGASSRPTWFTAGGDGLVYFQAQNARGRELWVTNGSRSGTMGVDIATGTASSSPMFFLAHGHGVLFQAWTPTRGRELWSSDLLEMPKRVARISAKRVVDRRGRSRWTHAQIRQLVTGASAIWGARANLTLTIDEIRDLRDPGLPTSWQKSSVLDKRSMEYHAEEEPAHFKWRTDAINLYFVDQLAGAAAMCSFAPCPSDDNDLIVIAAGASPIVLAHELGHYFGLSHTHANAEPSGCGCPHGRSGDCVLDTWDDADPTLCRPFTRACHDRNLAALDYVKSRHDVLRHNLMSYHSLTANTATLTCGQLQRLNIIIDGYRKHVLVGEPVARLHLTSPFRSRFPGPTSVVLSGTDLPTGRIRVRIGGQIATVDNASKTRLQPTFPRPLTPGVHTVSILRGKQLATFLTNGLEVTPSLRKGIDPDTSGDLIVVARSTLPHTLMMIGYGARSKTPIALPGIFHSLQVQLVGAVTSTTDARSQYRLPPAWFRGTIFVDVTIQALEVAGTRVTFTNPLRIVIP